MPARSACLAAPIAIVSILMLSGCTTTTHHDAEPATERTLLGATAADTPGVEPVVPPERAASLLLNTAEANKVVGHRDHGRLPFDREADFTQSLETRPWVDDSAATTASTGCRVLLTAGSAAVFGNDWTAFRSRQFDHWYNSKSDFEAVGLYQSPAVANQVLSRVVDSLHECADTGPTTGGDGTFTVRDARVTPHSADWTLARDNPRIGDSNHHLRLQVTGNAVIQISMDEYSDRIGALAEEIAHRTRR